MKKAINFKIAKLAVIEILLQVGFERASEDSLNILTDVFCHFLEQKFRRIKEIKEHRYGIHKLPLPFHVMCLGINTYSYKFKEIISFLEYQIFLKDYIKEKYKIEEDSLLQCLRVLPQKLNFKTIKKDFFLVNQEVKIDHFEKEEIEIDKHILEFIDDNLKKSKEENEEFSLETVENVDFLDEIADLSNNPIIFLDHESYKNYLTNKRLAEFTPIKNYFYDFESLTDDFIIHGEKFIERNND